MHARQQPADLFAEVQELDLRSAGQARGQTASVQVSSAADARGAGCWSESCGGAAKQLALWAAPAVLPAGWSS